MDSPIWNLGDGECEVNQNKYAVGDDVVIYYKTHAVYGSVSGESWAPYNGTSFTSLGYIQLRIINE